MGYTETKIKTYAKINICPNVICRRDDGYHELKVIMVPLILHDEFIITLPSEDCYMRSGVQLRMNETNIIVQAMGLMRRTFPLSECFHVHVEKYIPTRTGLTGGSADAAAIMRGIRGLLKLDIPLEELVQLGKRVGTNIPFCIMETCALIKGIGKRITPFAMPCDSHILLVKPAMDVPTEKTFPMPDFEKCNHPDCNEVIHALQQGNPVQPPSIVPNSLEYGAFQPVLEIADVKHRLQSIGSEAVLMSGSGGMVFVITGKKELL